MWLSLTDELSIIVIPQSLASQVLPTIDFQEHYCVTYAINDVMVSTKNFSFMLCHISIQLFWGKIFNKELIALHKSLKVVDAIRHYAFNEVV